MQPQPSDKHHIRAEYHVPDEPMYAPGSAAAMCCVMIAATAPGSARAAASSLRDQLAATPFDLTGAHVPRDAPGTIRLPWRDRDLLLSALASLRTAAPDSGRSIEAVLDRNTLASMVGIGAGLLRHVVGPRVRHWRFSAVSVEERVGLSSVTWTAVCVSENECYRARPTITVKGGLNSFEERGRMATRLAAACGLRLR